MDCPDQSGFKQFSFGSHHYAIVTQEGALYTFGNGKYLELGYGEKPVEQQTKPRKVEGIPPIHQVALGKYHSIAVGTDGTLWTWGWGGNLLSKGALGHGDKKSRGKPTLVEALKGEKIVGVAAGHHHSMVINDKGQVFAFGRGEFGVLGTGGSGDELAPVRLDALEGKKVQSIKCEAVCNAARMEDGSCWSWGKNESGQLGLGHGILDLYTIETVPVQVLFDSALSEASEDERQQQQNIQVVSLDCGTSHMAACTTEGRLYYWGGKMHFSPNLITGDSGTFLKQKIVKVATGNGFTAAVDQDGQLFTFGRGKSGCLGHGNKQTLRIPTRVEGFGPQNTQEAKERNPFGRVVQVFGGNNLIAALTEEGV
jgi:alpha-tubulin suppressor-like RCC1 family protein